MNWARVSMVADGCGASSWTVWKLSSLLIEGLAGCLHIMKRFAWSGCSQRRRTIFCAYRDKRARESWPAPSQTAEVRILNEDIRTGGSASALCGAKGEFLSDGRSQSFGRA
jgi:hypothetical protein